MPAAGGFVDMPSSGRPLGHCRFSMERGRAMTQRPLAAGLVVMAGVLPVRGCMEGALGVSEKVVLK